MMPFLKRAAGRHFENADKRNRPVCRHANPDSTDHGRDGLMSAVRDSLWSAFHAHRLFDFCCGE